MIPLNRILAGGLSAVAALCIAGAVQAAEYKNSRGFGPRAHGPGHWQHPFKSKFNRHAGLRRRHVLAAGFAGPTVIYGIDGNDAPSVVDRSTSIECYSFNPACGQPTSTYGLIEYDGRGRPVSQHFESPQPYAPPAFIRIP